MRIGQLVNPALFGRFCMPLMLVLASAPALDGATKGIRMPVVPKWSRFEQVFRSSVLYSNPVQQARLEVIFTSPEGEVTRVPAFWDGGRTWKVRFSPGQAGHWTYHTVCSDVRNEGLHQRSGGFTCTSALGQSRFDEHGLVQVSRDQRRLVYTDQSPFLWIADTAWSGARVSVQKDWEVYAQIRLDQGFSTVMWVAAPGLDDRREGPTTGYPDSIGINPEFFQRMDRKLAVLANAGVLSAIVPFSDTDWDQANGPPVPDDQVAVLIRYIVSRWGADPVVWVLPTEPVAGRQRDWLQIGRSVFAGIGHAPVMVHVGSRLQDLEKFLSMGWVNLMGMKPDISFGEGSSRRLLSGSSSLEGEPFRPRIVFTPTENSVQDDKRLAAEDIRRAAYWSWLTTGAAGLSYAANGVQNWDTTTGQAGEVAAELPMWRKSMFLQGGKQMGILGKLMSSIADSSLSNDRTLLAGQSGGSALKSHAAASSPNRDLALLYVPEGRSVEVNLAALPASPVISWFNPRTGESTPAVAVVSGEGAQFPTPAEGDWLLVARRGR